MTNVRFTSPTDGHGLYFNGETGPGLRRISEAKCLDSVGVLIDEFGVIYVSGVFIGYTPEALRARNFVDKERAQELDPK